MTYREYASDAAFTLYLNTVTIDQARLDLIAHMTAEELHAAAHTRGGTW